MEEEVSYGGNPQQEVAILAFTDDITLIWREIRAVSAGEEYVGRILQGHVKKEIKEKILEVKETVF